MTDTFTKASPRPGVEIGIVPVQMNATNFKIRDSQNNIGQVLFWGIDSFMLPLDYKRLPPGSYTFLFCSLSATEEQAREIVGSIKMPLILLFKDYEYDEDYTRALESLQSLLRSLGLDPSLNFAILKIN